MDKLRAKQDQERRAYAKARKMREMMDSQETQARRAAEKEQRQKRVAEYASSPISNSLCPLTHTRTVLSVSMRLLVVSRRERVCAIVTPPILVRGVLTSIPTTPIRIDDRVVPLFVRVCVRVRVVCLFRCLVISV